MIKPFLNEDFLLSNKVGKELYHEYASKMPILDFHNHLVPADICANRSFDNLTQAWLEDDHYKWRAMRANGVDESFITGKGKDWEKFKMWAESVPHTIRNPLYHWTHLELRRYFGIDELLDGQTASKIYQETKEALKAPENSCRGLLEKMNVEILCTTDDPTDDLTYHQELAKTNFKIKVYPTFRLDGILNVTGKDFYRDYLSLLSEKSNIRITDLSTLLEAIQQRISVFHQQGCRLSDVGLKRIPRKNTSLIPESIFQDVLEGKTLSADKAEDLQLFILIEVCKMYHSKGWVQQFHLGAIRGNNKRALRENGPVNGYDSIGDFKQAESLSYFLDLLNDQDQLSKTIIYNSNPSDNDLFSTMIGNFQDGKIVGKIQYGPSWWFLDQKTGIEAQINSISNMGLLSRFVGMVTDSRSFLSFPRHEYFRRILCNLIGNDVVSGELPDDRKFLGKMIQDISYGNAKSFFEFNK
jgi:glucuronate isomerase